MQISGNNARLAEAIHVYHTSVFSCVGGGAECSTGGAGENVNDSERVELSLCPSASPVGIWAATVREPGGCWPLEPL